MSNAREIALLSPRPVLSAILLSTLLAGAARAETLRDAIAQADRTSPVLHGQQALQRATAEGGVQARAGWKPQIGVTASGGYQRQPYDTLNFGYGAVDSNQAQAALTVTQPVYTGGRVANAVRAADARTLAGVAGLHATEEQVFQSVIGAYMDVLRDGTILSIRRADLQTLTRQVANTAARFKLGTGVTRTDVAQAKAQQLAAQAALDAAQAQLAASRANYTAIVGAVPTHLTDPGNLPDLPASLHAALARAAAADPLVAQSRLTALASADDIATERAAAMPSVGVQASFGTIGPASPLHTGLYQQQASAIVTVTVPIYQGGLIASQVRAARDRNAADQAAADNTARQAVQAVLTDWSATRTGLAAIAANTAQVKSAELALRGYQTEYGYGLRSTLDVLIADENLRAAQVSLAESRHDTLVAEAALLAATGDLRFATLMRGTPPAGGTMGP